MKRQLIIVLEVIYMNLRTIRFFSTVAEKNLSKHKTSFNSQVLNDVFNRMQEKINREKIKIESLPDEKKPKAADQKELHNVLEKARESRIKFSAY